jgi:hypothetical protein
MHAPLDRPNDRSNKTGYDNQPKNGNRFPIVPVLIAMLLLFLVVIQPNASRWISEAVQAEFSDGVTIDTAAKQPTQPGMTTRTVRAY